MLKNMPKFIKGSEEAKEQMRKMREARGVKQSKIEETVEGLVAAVEEIKKLLHVPLILVPPSVSETPVIEEPKEPTGLDLLPDKAKEILKAEFPEAKIVSVVPWAKGGFAINIDVTHLTGGSWTTAMIGREQTRIFNRDIRDIPVIAMEMEKSMKDRIKLIKQNMGWIKKEATPQFTEKELKPEERPLPPGIKGTPEAEFFTTSVE